MSKTLLHFGQPTKLSLKLDQLVIERTNKPIVTRPIEDIACLIIEHPEVNCTAPLLVRAAEKNVLIIWCDAKHLPVAYSSPLAGNTLINLRHRQQWSAGVPAMKQAWAQIIKAKLHNQGLVLKALGAEPATLFRMAKDVRSGDSQNLEAQGARYYWSRIFGEFPGFNRDAEGDYPNFVLNYGYAIIRAAMARALIGSGLCVTLGIHHHNQYNAYALADDCMEPYRPWVDYQVALLCREQHDTFILSKEMKAKLLLVLHQDALHKGNKSPMLSSMELLSSSLAKYFAGETKKLNLPEFPNA